MTNNTAEKRIGSWQAPHANLSIQYPLDILHEIRLAVCERLDRQPRRITETGGVLFGYRQHTTLRIAAWRPLPCEHAQGGALVLSEKDLRDLADLLHAAEDDPDLRNMDVLGWFVSHPQGSLELTADDLHIFDLCFPAPGQFALVLCPRRTEPISAAFFIRDVQGHISDRDGSPDLTLAWPEERSYFRPSRPLLEASPETCENGRDTDPRGQLSFFASTLPAGRLDPARGSANLTPRVLRRRERRTAPWVRWMWVVPLLAFVIFAGFLSRERFYADQPTPPTLGLRLEEAAPSQLRIDWDRTAAPIHQAKRASINVDDGGAQRTFDLDAQQLAIGSFIYGRHAGTVKVKLAVFNENIGGPAVEESAQFVGTAPARAASHVQTDSAQQNADLESEIKRLRARLADETAKRHELENLVRILEQRQGINPDQ